MTFAAFLRKTLTADTGARTLTDSDRRMTSRHWAAQFGEPTVTVSRAAAVYAEEVLAREVQAITANAAVGCGGYEAPRMEAARQALSVGIAESERARHSTPAERASAFDRLCTPIAQPGQVAVTTPARPPADGLYNPGRGDVTDGELRALSVVREALTDGRLRTPAEIAEILDSYAVGLAGDDE